MAREIVNSALMFTNGNSWEWRLEISGSIHQLELKLEIWFVTAMWKLLETPMIDIQNQYCVIQ